LLKNAQKKGISLQLPRLAGRSKTRVLIQIGKKKAGADDVAEEG